MNIIIQKYIQLLSCRSDIFVFLYYRQKHPGGRLQWRSYRVHGECWDLTLCGVEFIVLIIETHVNSSNIKGNKSIEYKYLLKLLHTKKKTFPMDTSLLMLVLLVILKVSDKSLKVYKICIFYYILLVVVFSKPTLLLLLSP